MTTGERIKKFRLEQGLSQIDLGYITRMSESAIRNYELGNRNPSKKRLELIAKALKVNVYALEDFNIENRVKLFHLLFYLEDKYGFTIKEDNGKLYFQFYDSLLHENSKEWPDLRPSRRDFEEWHKEYESYINGDITKEEYDMWRNSYPRIRTERITKFLREDYKKNVIWITRIQNNINLTSQ